MKQGPTQKAPINTWRVASSAAYLVLAGVLYSWRRETLFYILPHSDSFNLDRLAWCVICAFVGFAVLAFHLRRHPKSPFPEYISYYPPVLLMISALVFSACHMFERSSGFVFYYLSSSACFTLAFLVDRFWSLVASPIGKKI
jgi:hypothetical protein